MFNAIKRAVENKVDIIFAADVDNPSIVNIILVDTTNRKTSTNKLISSDMMISDSLIPFNEQLAVFINKNVDLILNQRK